MAPERKVKKISCKRYATAEECLAAYFGCEPTAIPKKGSWVWKDSWGKVHSLSMASALRSIRRRGTWGWCEGKKIIHYWASPRAEFRDILRLFAHEIGHMRKPHYKSLREEQKACEFADVSSGAWDMAMQVMAEGQPCS